MEIHQLIQQLTYKLECKKECVRKSKALKQKKREILAHYRSQPSDDPEIAEALLFLKKNSLQTFCADFPNDYSWKKVQVFTDEAKGLRYVLHKGKRLYFVRSYRTRTIQYCYSGLMAEQDTRSPHCYLSEAFQLNQNDVLMDVGSAEGILSLEHIEKLSRVILFERDPLWVDALEATFEPWKDKVSIVRKYVSNLNDEENISLDNYLSDKDFTPNFVKIDVEGAEQRVLKGMSRTLDTPGLKIAVCTYHQNEDLSKLTNSLVQKSFTCKPTKGYMIFLNQMENLQPPYFRKGLIRATKQ